jgi:archaellum component FlaC
MQNILSNSNTDNAKEEMEGIKKDIESLVKRLSNIKDNAGGIMTEQLDSLSSTIAELKDKTVSSSRDNLADLCTSTRRHPLRNLAYAFGAGFVLAYLL